MINFILRQPISEIDFEKYFELRWRILRKPWNQLPGSEKDDDEDSSYHVMALHKDTVIGVARLQFPHPSRAQLRYMAVDNQYEGNGIGRAIIEHMEEFARQQGSKSVFLHARDNAVGFYKKLGYSISEKSYLLFDSIQHYKMNKTL